MIFDQGTNYYEVLEIPADASAQDIRNAYQKMKGAYKKDNLALYSVMDASETDEMVAKIEEAYHILSDPEARREYDERHGIHNRIEDKIVSIDRVPPMDSGDDTDLLVPPSTDFGTASVASTPAASTPRTAPTGPGPITQLATGQRHEPGFSAPEGSFIDRRTQPSRRAADLPILGQAKPDTLTDEIQHQTEWRGSFLKRVRELRRCSIDDLATQTKISKTYIHAIEEEAYEKLPAAVFVRGFVVQISKVLKLPADQVAQAYMARYKR